MLSEASARPFLALRIVSFITKRAAYALLNRLSHVQSRKGTDRCEASLVERHSAMPNLRSRASRFACGSLVIKATNPIVHLTRPWRHKIMTDAPHPSDVLFARTV